MNNDVVAFDFENERFEMRTYVPYEEKRSVAIEYAARITYIDEDLGVVTQHMDGYASSRKVLTETYLVGPGKKKIADMSLADFMDNYGSLLDVMMNVRRDIQEDIAILEWMKDDCIKATKAIDEAKTNLQNKIGDLVKEIAAINDNLDVFGNTEELTNRLIEVTESSRNNSMTKPTDKIKQNNILNFAKKEEK